MRNLIGAFGFAFVLVFLVASPVKAQWHFPVIPGPGPNSASSLGATIAFLLTPQIDDTRARCGLGFGSTRPYTAL
jgi:hypothetical protein